MQRPSLEGLQAAIAHLETEVAWDLLLLQELCMPTETWPLTAESVLGGHQLLTNPAKIHDTAVLVNRRFLGCGRVVANFAIEQAVGVTVRCGAETVQCVSVHLPTSWETEEDFVEAVELVADQVDQGATHKVLGMDANVELHYDRDDLLETVGPTVTGTRASARGDALLAGLLWPFDLKLLNTFEPAASVAAAGGCWTHAGGALAGHRRRQIDYIGYRADEQVQAVNTATASILAAGHCRSDHRPLYFRLEGREGLCLRFENRRRSLKSWHPKKEQLPRLVSQLRRGLENCNTCGELQTAVASFVENLEPDLRTTAAVESPLFLLHPYEQKLIGLQTRCLELVEGSAEIAKVRKAMWKTKVKLRRVRMLKELSLLGPEVDATAAPLRKRRRAFQGARFPRALLDPSSRELVQDHGLWPELIGRYFELKFTAGRLPPAVLALPDLEVWRSTAQSDRVDGRALADQLTYSDVEQARAWLRLGSQTGKDNIPAEVLMLVDSLGLQKATDLFDRRLRGLAEWQQEFDEIPAWKEFILIGIPKKFAPQSNLDKWRGIALCSAVLKWYEIAAWILLDRHLRPLPDWIVGFRPGRQVLDITAGLATALSKAHEWHQPLVIMSSDVAAAFDIVSPELLAEALDKRGAPACLVFSTMRELVGLRAEPVLAGAQSPSVAFIGGPQGRPRIPAAWSHVLAFILQDLVDEWSLEADFGLPSLHWCPEWGNGSLLVWADNIYVITDSVQKATARTRQVEDRLFQWGIKLGGDSFEMLVNEKAQLYKFGVELKMRAGTVKEVRQLKALGTMLDDKGSTEGQLRHRLQAAAVVWVRWRSVLCNSSAPLYRRLAKLDQTVGNSTLFGAGAWALSASSLSTLKVAGNRWARFMQGRKPESSTWLGHLSKCNKRVLQARRIHQIPDWSTRALRAVHGWHGHLARSWAAYTSATTVPDDTTVRGFGPGGGGWTENIENLARNRFIPFQSTPPPPHLLYIIHWSSARGCCYTAFLYSTLDFGRCDVGVAVRGVVAYHPSSQRVSGASGGAGLGDGAPAAWGPATPQRAPDLLDIRLGLEDQNIGQRPVETRSRDIRGECFGVVQEGHEEDQAVEGRRLERGGLPPEFEEETDAGAASGDHGARLATPLAVSRRACCVVRAELSL